MSHQLPQFGYIVDFLIGIVVVFILAQLGAAGDGYREK